MSCRAVRSIPLLFLLLLISSIRTNRTCKTQLIRSFTLHSRIAPNRQNSVCPNIGINCCTRHDQMKMHKMWVEHTKPHLQSTHLKSLEALGKLNAVAGFKDQIDIGKIVDVYEEFGKPKPHVDVIMHLDKIEAAYKAIEGKVLVEKLKALPDKMKEFYEEVQKMRGGLLCSICNWHNHRYYDLDARSLTYSTKFCDKLVTKFIDILAEKYMEVVQYLLLLDELFFVLTDHRLMEEHLDRAIFHRYILIIKKCRENPNEPTACEDVCREFNLNRLTYMFDGESKVFLNFIKRFMDIVDTLIGEKEDYLKLFSLRKKLWSLKVLKEFTTKKSVLGQEIKADPTATKSKKTGFDLKFVTPLVKNYIERHHPINTIHIETLDDEITMTTLYKLMDHPLDISGFDISFDSNGGIDLVKDSIKLNLDITTEALLALVDAKGGNADSLSEILDEEVKVMLIDLNITDLSNFLTDEHMDFKKMKKLVEPVEEEVPLKPGEKPIVPVKPKPQPQPKPPVPGKKPTGVLEEKTKIKMPFSTKDSGKSSFRPAALLYTILLLGLYFK